MQRAACGSRRAAQLAEKRWLAYLPAAVPHAINPVAPSLKEIADFCHDGIQFMLLDDLFDTIVIQIWRISPTMVKLTAPHTANTPAACSGSPLRAAQPKGCPPGGRCCRIYVTKKTSIELTNRLFHLIRNSLLIVLNGHKMTAYPGRAMVLLHDGHK